ncbi:hypothetical protein GCM10023178_04140 [Actinomadura luteofluorescens]
MVENSVQLCQKRPRPHSADGDLHAEHAFDSEDDAEFAGERRQPVVPVRQDDDLPEVADLEQLLRSPVHVADDGLGRRDAFAVQGELQPEHTVRGGVLGADVQGHVLGGELLGARTDPDDPFGGHGRASATPITASWSHGER